MCTFASFVLTKTAAFWSRSGDSHETIIAEHGLRDESDRVQIVRVELTPPEDDPRCADLARWSFVVDQDVVPELLQEQVHPDRVEAEARRFLAEGPARERMLADLARVRTSLGEPGVVDHLAGVVDGLARGRTLPEALVAGEA